MGKTPTSPPHQRAGASQAAPRADHHTEDDRPFAEIRRLLQDVIRILALHPRSFFVPFCLAASTVLFLSLYTARTYTAWTTFERRNDPVAKSINMSRGAASYESFRGTMLQDLTSAAAMAEVVETMGLTDDLPRGEDNNLTAAGIRERDRFGRMLGASLHLSTTSPSELVDRIKITYTGADPAIGRRLVDVAQRVYIRRTREWIRQYLVEHRAYFKEQLDKANTELVAARRQETRLRMNYPFVDPTDPGAISVKLSQLEREHGELALREREHEADLIAQEQMIASLEQTGIVRGDTANSTVSLIPLGPLALRLTRQIREAQGEIDKLRGARGMTAAHPDIVALKTRIEDLQAELRHHAADPQQADATDANASPGDGLLPAIPSAWRPELAAARVRAQAIRDKIQQIRADLKRNESMTTRMGDVKKNVYHAQEEFAEVRDRVSEARSAQSKLQATVTAIDPAITATDQDRLVSFVPGPTAQGGRLPIAPKTKNILALALLVGLAAGVIFLILAEILDHVYRSTAQVAKSLGLPILDAIDEIVTAADRRRQIVRRLVVNPMIFACGLLLTSLTGAMAYLSLNNPTAYQSLRKLPQSAIEFFAGDAAEQPSDSVVDSDLIQPSDDPPRQSS